MPKEKLPKPIADAALSYVKLAETAREATNAANRQKTVLKNEVKSHWITEKLPIGSYVRCGGFEFRYEGAETTTYDTEAILKAFEEGEITREAFLRIMKVDPKQLANVFGADQAADLTMTTVGDKLDIRVESLPVEREDDTFIMVERNIKTKQKRSVFGKRKEETAVAVKKSKRSIKVRRND